MDILGFVFPLLMQQPSILVQPLGATVKNIKQWGKQYLERERDGGTARKVTVA